MSLIFLFSNLAQTVLASSINTTQTTITVQTGTGSLFPSPSPFVQQFAVTLTPASTPSLPGEIMYCTARSGDVLTVERAQEGTTPIAYAAGDIVQNLITAASLSSFSQGASGRLLGTQVVAMAGTSVPTYPAGTAMVDIEMCAGGASGGGAALTSGSQGSAGSGGGSGGYVRALVTIANATGATLTIGARGAAGAAGANGNDGGDSDFGGIVHAYGGAHGTAGAAVAGPATTGSANTTALSIVAAGSTAVVLGAGASSQLGFVMSTTDVSGGQGAASYFGAGADWAVGAGAPGIAPGSGGSGGSNVASMGSAVAGGAGVPGQAILRSYS